MDENKNVKESSDQLLSLLDKYSAENRNVVKETAAKKAVNSEQAVKPKAPMQDDDDDVIIFKAPKKAAAPTAQPAPAAPKSAPTAKPEVKPQIEAQPAPADSHYSDEGGLDGVVRAVPEGGHLTDENGNSVSSEVGRSEDVFSEQHFSGNEEAREAARKAYKKAKKRNAPKKKKGSITVSIIKAVAYTAIVCCLSFFMVFGFFDFWPGIIPIANDVFAFSKGDKEINITLEENMNTNQVADLLVEKGVISEAKVFKFYVRYKYDESVGLDKEKLVGSAFHLVSEFCKSMFFGGDIAPEFEREYLSGTHTLSTKMNYDQLLYALTTEAYVREEVTVTIPEGFTTEQIIALLLSKGVGTREGYEYAINEYPYKHEFVQMLTQSSWAEGRTYRLEGYLYPDTYIFYKDSSEVEVINKLLNSFSNRIWSEYYTTYKSACDDMGFTFDEMVIFASIVQAEGKSFADFENVSQVFHNRRNSKIADFRRMESCATIQYAMDYDNAQNGIEAVRKPVLSDSDLLYQTPYNTYMYEGLPPGAICNPGLDAIEAALYPDMSDEIKKEFMLTTAYYFNSDMAGNMYYAQNANQHSLNKQKADKVNQQIQNGTYTE